jgi:hypothetical protein
VWAGKTREESIRRQLTNNPFPPGEQRVNGEVRNLMLGTPHSMSSRKTSYTSHPKNESTSGELITIESRV